MKRSPFGPITGSTVFAAILYGAMTLTANTAGAGDLTAENRAVLKEMRQGDMTKVVVLDEPRAPIESGFVDLYGNSVDLGEFAGKVVLVNFWATWCPPCRAEMPSIDALAGSMESDDFAVVTISTDRGGAEKAQSFFDQIQIENLKLYHDRSRDMARQAGVLGLPVTLIMDREGREIARMHGDADWNTAEARAFLTRIIEMTGSERV